MRYKLILTMFVCVFIVSFILPQIGATFSVVPNVTIAPLYDSSIVIIVVNNSSTILEIVNNPGFDPDGIAIAGYELLDTGIGGTILNVFFNFSMNSGNRIDITNMSTVSVSNDNDANDVSGQINTNELYVTATGLGSKENVQLDLGSDATTNLQLSIDNDGNFTLGFSNRNLASGVGYSLNSSESSTPPVIIVASNCNPPATGNWFIISVCVVTGEDVVLNESQSLLVGAVGHLVLLEGSNVSFTGTNQFINLRNGGRVNVCAKCVFPQME